MGREGRLVLRPEDSRLFRGHEIEVCAAQQLVTLATHHGAECIIEKDESVLLILDEDRVGNGVDDVRQRDHLARRQLQHLPFAVDGEAGADRQERRRRRGSGELDRHP